MIDLYSEKPLTSKLDVWALGIMLYKLCFYTLPFGESSLAIQSGNVTFPTSSPYSEELHNLIRYILTVEPDSRPDIFQVSHLAHTLAKRKCPVQNLHVCPDAHCPHSVTLILIFYVCTERSCPYV